MEALKEELRRTKLNEKRLMDTNKELKNKLLKLMSVETFLEKERVEVAKLKKKLNAADLQSDKLRETLTKVKTELRNSETNRSQEKTAFEQKTMDLEKKCLHFENCFSIEKTLREQKENELEKLCDTNEKNKQLTKQVQTLEHDVEELKGYKKFASKTMDDGRQQMKKNELESLKKDDELKKMRLYANHNKLLEEELMSCKISLKSAMTVNEKREEEIKQQAKQIVEYKGEIHSLRKKTADLTNTVGHHHYTIQLLHNEVDKLKNDNKSLTEKSESKCKEIEELCDQKLKLEDKLNLLGHLEQLVDKREKEIISLTAFKDRQLIELQSLINELERKLKLQIIETDRIKAVEKQGRSSLLKVQQELDLTNKTIKDLENKIRDQKLQLDEKNHEVVRLRRKYCSVRKQHKKVLRELIETKRTQKNDKISASKDQTLAETVLAKMAAEKQQLEDELTRCKETILQQQQVINFQDAGNVTQEFKLREHLDEIKFLRQEIRILNRKVLSLDKTKLRHRSHLLQKAKIRANTGLVKPHVFIRRNLENVEKKDKEIEELKRMLARRPDDAIQKLQQCRWANRDLNKKLRASQGGLIVYEAKCESVMEENKKLTDEVRKLKLEMFAEKTKVRLPPISKEVKPPSEGKQQRMLKPWHTSRHTRFPVTTTKSQCQFEGIFKCVALPPIGSNHRPKPPKPLGES